MRLRQSMKKVRNALIAFSLLLILVDFRLAGILLHPYVLVDSATTPLHVERIHATFLDLLAFVGLLLLHGAVIFGFIKAKNAGQH
jgi:hypothetical protein